MTGSQITNSYATGAVSGSGAIGGLVGANYDAITDAYATGAVSGNADGRYVGGLIGFNAGGTITDAYATGMVSGTGYVGGLVGYNCGAISMPTRPAR